MPHRAQPQVQENESDGFAEAYWREQARIRGEIVSHLEAERDRYREALNQIARMRPLDGGHLGRDVAREALDG